MRRFSLTQETREKVCDDFEVTEAEIREAEKKIEEKLYFVQNDEGIFDGFLLLPLHVPVLLSMTQVEVCDAKY